MRIQAAVSRADSPAPAIETVELEGPRRDELLVRIVATGICHTDLHAHEGRLSPLPIVLGHEGAGIVEAIGESVVGFAPGDHVVLSGSSCGLCPNCAANVPSYCDQAMPRSFGGQRMDGSTALADGEGPLHSHFFGQSSFATHSIVPERTAVKVDADLPLEQLGPLGCGIITGAGSILESLRVGAGATVAVFGVGGVGLSAVMAARLAGARRIVAIDLHRERLDLALELGATDAISADSEEVAKQVRAVTGRGVDFTLNTTTVPAVFTAAVDCLAMRGTAAFVTAPRGEWSPAMFPMLAGGRMLRGILGGDAAPRRFIPMLIDYWRQGRFPFERLLTFYDFADIGRAFADTAAGRVIKPVLRMKAGR
ncbi:NAD(P)-dependent alcohol dehydrogenase [Sphingosinicella terrae]|uniref:NAD(P)-dependent alcohol dehydrogenase n=1 Tax=Sphingosinicella terrae TaxID=2172047 RepID=UPI000E0D6074|nr:NAD(P)-dependent alcohol dehydrogenase [Sphingosinicella terrae]